LGTSAVLGQPANDNFTSAVAIVGRSGFVAGSNAGATAEVSEPRHAGASGGASVWWRWTSPASGSVVFSTIGSHFDTVMAVYVGETMESLVVTAENNDDVPADLDPIIIGAVFGHQSRVEFEAEAGTTYRIAVDGAGAVAATDEVILSWVQGLTNDDFDDATGIAGTKGMALGSTKGATSESGERDPSGLGSGASVWWRWTAPSNGPVTFALVRTEEEDFETLLRVYTGSSVNDLALVAANDSPIGFLLNLESSVTFPADEGTQYWIAVDGAFGETPDVVLRWTRDRENDDFGDAFEIVGATGTTTGDNIFATPEPFSEPDHGGLPGNASVWWNWTAPTGGPVTFNTFGSSFDTILAVYVGDEVWEDGVPFPILDLAPIASNHDAGGGVQSLVNFVAVTGTTYRIAVVNYDRADRGKIVLNWQRADPPIEPLRIEGVSRLPDGAFRFNLRGPAGTVGTILRSSGLDSWQPWRPFSLEGGALEVIDTEAGAAAAFFYKVAAP